MADSCDMDDVPDLRHRSLDHDSYNAVNPATQLLAYTYIDLVVGLSRQHQVAKDIEATLEALEKLDPDWHANLEDPQAKTVLKEAINELCRPQPNINIKFPGKLAV